MKLVNTFLGLIAVFIFVNISNAQYYYNRAFNLPGGAGNYVVADPGPNLSITGSFTVECWVRPNSISSPANQILVQKRLGSAASGYTLYAGTGGRPTIRTNGTTRLNGTDSIKNNVWNHVAGTFNAITGVFVVYLNGVACGTVTVAAGMPSPDADSLRIGAGFNSPYNGLIDEIRIWNVERTAAEIAATMRIPLGVTGGIYPGLVAVYRANTVTGGSGTEPINGYNAYLRGGSTYADIGSNPGSPMAFNTGLISDGIDGQYVAIPNSAATSPTIAMTLEAWVYSTSSAVQVVFGKGLSNYPYRLLQSTGSTFRVVINGTVPGTGNYGGVIPLNKWTHLAFTYNGTTYAYYMNGIQTQTGTQSISIPTNADSVTIGGGSSLAEWTGMIDEVRISNYAKLPLHIVKGMYVSIDSNNELNQLDLNLAFNFEGTLQSYADTITGKGVFNGNGIRFTQTVNNPAELPTPLNRYDAINFASGFSTRYSNLFIGSAPPATVTDSVFFPNSTIISDINVFVGIEHSYANDVSVSLKNHAGTTTLVLYPGAATDAGMNFVTIFDDQADSTIGGSLKAPFSPRVKPTNALSIFNGQNTLGWWKIIVTDNVPSSNNGTLVGWGIQFNNQTLVGVENNFTGIADKFSLSQNYPNPFNPTTTIKYSLAKDVNVKILLFDILGREIQTLTNEFQKAGSYELLFNAKSLSSGTYFYKIIAGDFVETKKMLLIK